MGHRTDAYLIGLISATVSGQHRGPLTVSITSPIHLHLRRDTDHGPVTDATAADGDFPVGVEQSGVALLGCAGPDVLPETETRGRHE